MNTEVRTPKLMIILGTNGTGKTTFSKKLIANELKKDDSHILIVTPDDFEFNTIPWVHPRFQKRIATYKGARKIIYQKGLIENIRENFRNGMIHFEDCRAYFDAALDRSLHSLLIRRRQQMIDILVCGHGFTEVPPKFFTFATHYILFRTIDKIERRKGVIQNYEVMLEAQRRVNEKAIREPHYYEIIPV